MPSSQLGQIDFTGGMQLTRKPTNNEYLYGRNLILRNGHPETRPSIQRSIRKTQQTSDTSFYFGELTVPSGFWFPFLFNNVPTIDTLDGYGVYRFDGMENKNYIILSNGNVLVEIENKYYVVPTVESLLGDTSVSFVSGNNEVLMLRGPNKSILVWRKGTPSFVVLEGTEVPTASHGIYAFNRFWLVNGSNVWGSDLLDSTKWSMIGQSFSFSPGDGEVVTALVEFKDDYLMVFKETKIFVMSGVTTPIESGGYLSDNIVVDTVDSDIGCVNQHSVVVKGEQVYFLSKVGMSSISRTTEGNIYGIDLLMTEPIKPLIDSINFDANKTSMAYFDNYLLLCAPTDNREEPDKIFLYDLSIGQGGKWISVWDSVVKFPLMFYKIDDNTKLVGLCSDGVTRVFFNEDPWDSEDIVSDVLEYNPLILYPKTSYISNPDNDQIYVSLRESINKNPSTESDYWELVGDTYDISNIITSIETSIYGDESEFIPKKIERAEIIYEQQDSNVSVFSCDNFSNSKQPIRENDSPDYTTFKVHGETFEPDNSLLNFNDPDRSDYSWLINSAGFYIQASEGIFVGDWTNESIRFTILRNYDYGFGIKIENTSGKIKLHGIAFIFTQKRFAGKGR